MQTVTYRKRGARLFFFGNLLENSLISATEHPTARYMSAFLW